MGSKNARHKLRSEDFILKVLRDYYSSGESKYFISHKYDVNIATFLRWLKKYDLEGKELSLSREIIERVKAMRKKKEMENAPKTREEELEQQVANLRKALEYSELRNKGLMKIIEFSSKEYGEDLLKKAGAKQ